MEPTPAVDEAPKKTSFLQGKRLPSAIVAGGAAFAMTLAGLGIANAQTDGSTPSTAPAPADGEGEGAGDGHRLGRGHTHADHHPHARLSVAAEAIGITTAELRDALVAGSSIASVAEGKGVAPQTVIDALVADATGVLNEAVENGRITREQADARIATLPERMTEHVNRVRAEGDGERRHHPGMKGAKPNLDAAATALGITPEELRTELHAGKSLATIAGEKDVEVGAVVSALVADAKARLAQAVTDGKLTQAEADERSANLEARITDLVNRAGRPHLHDGPRDAGAGAEPAVFSA